MEKAELEKKLEALGDVTNEQRKNIICSLIGHSKIVGYCFGYISCGRCGEQLGDTLAGVYDTTKNVIIGHNCPTCKDNYDKLDWTDKYETPEPF